jgi:thioesterase domain-containing protein
MVDIAADYVRVIRKAQPHGPYILAGLCSAGVIAFEAARQLQGAGESVPLVITADTSMPDYERAMSFRERLIFSVRRLAHWNLHRLKLLRDGRATIPEVMSQFTFMRMSRILDLAAWFGLIDPSEQGQDDRATWLFLRALNRAHENFVPTEPFAGDVVIFKSELFAPLYTDPNLGWTNLVHGKIFVHEVPGWHEGIFQGEGPTLMAEYLRPLLQKVDAQRDARAPGVIEGTA